MAETNAAQIAAEMLTLSPLAMLRGQACVVKHGLLLETAIKRNASGRPGPNAPTGDYRGSWTNEVQVSGGKTTATVGTNRPQARRLEYGFVGADVLGRVYNQPPFPHVGPAVQSQGDAFRREFEQAIRGES